MSDKARSGLRSADWKTLAFPLREVMRGQPKLFTPSFYSALEPLVQANPLDNQTGSAYAHAVYHFGVYTQLFRRHLIRISYISAMPFLEYICYCAHELIKELGNAFGHLRNLPPFARIFLEFARHHDARVGQEKRQNQVLYGMWQTTDFNGANAWYSGPYTESFLNTILPPIEKNLFDTCLFTAMPHQVDVEAFRERFLSPVFGTIDRRETWVEFGEIYKEVEKTLSKPEFRVGSIRNVHEDPSDETSFTPIELPVNEFGFIDFSEWFPLAESDEPVLTSMDFMFSPEVFCRVPHMSTNGRVAPEVFDREMIMLTDEYTMVCKYFRVKVSAPVAPAHVISTVSSMIFTSSLSEFKPKVRQVAPPKPETSAPAPQSNMWRVPPKSQAPTLGRRQATTDLAAEKKQNIEKGIIFSNKMQEAAELMEEEAPKQAVIDEALKAQIIKAHEEAKRQEAARRRAEKRAVNESGSRDSSKGAPEKAAKASKKASTQKKTSTSKNDTPMDSQPMEEAQPLIDSSSEECN